MNISNGISVINFISQANSTAKTQKAYLWPAYNNGIVNKINRLSDKIASNISYVNPSLNENDAKNNFRDFEYNSSGKITTSPSAYYPGQYLNILA